MKKRNKFFLVIFVMGLSILVTFGWLHQCISAEKEYPIREINVYIGFPPGGGVDITGRLLCKSLEKILRVPIVVINKPGASSAVATIYVQNANPDGYTLLYTLSPYAVLQKIQEPSLPYTIDNLTFLGATHSLYIFLTVRADSPWKTYEEFVDHAKKTPVKFGTIGTISANRALESYFAERVGIKLIHVPYLGSSQSARALLGNEVEAVTQATPAAQYVLSGDFRWLVLFGPKRSSTYPEIPAITEKDKGFNLFFGYTTTLIGPKGLPAPVEKKLIAAFKEAGKSKEVEDVLKKFNYVPEYLTPKECIELWKSEEKIYDEWVKKAAIK